MFKNLVCILLACLFFISCNNEEQTKNSIPLITIDSTKTDFEIKITKWQLLGPFPDDNKRFTQSDISTENPGLYCDYLKDFGLAEGNIKVTDIISITRSISDHKENLTEEFTNKIVEDESKYIFFNNYFKSTDKSTVYAFCEIFSAKEQDVLFDMGSDDGMKVWLNNQLILNKAIFGWIRDYKYMVVGHLKKGRNLFYVKVYNSVLDWGLYVNIYSLTAAKKILKTNNSLSLLDNLLYNIGDTLSINTSLFTHFDKNAVLTINDYKGEEIFNKRIHGEDISLIDLSQYPKGAYQLKVNATGTNYKQNFYYGNDIDSLYPGFLKRSEKIYDEKARINLEALLTRYKHLIDSENKKLQDQIWQRKIIFVIKELEDVLYKLENNEESFKNTLGKHLRGFRSTIDNQNQYYKLYIPDNYRNGKNPLPVVVFVPFRTDPTRAFLKSFHVANMNVEDEQIKAAEKYGYILLWINARGYVFGNPIEQADFFEVLDEVKKDYNIDENKIYLTGTCSGGLSSLTFGMRYPSKFAAIGVFSPITIQSGVAQSFLDVKYDSEVFWLAQNSPSFFTGNYSNLPIYILHGHKNEVPEKQSLIFTENCKNNNIKPYFKITYDERDPEITSTDYTVFDFFKGKKKNNNPKVIDFSTTQLKYNQSYWITIDRVISFSKVAKIHAEHLKENVIKVTTENIAQFSIDLSDIKLDRTKPLTIIANEKKVNYKIASEKKVTIDVFPAPKNSQLIKNCKIEGPISHAFSNGFLLVDCENESKIDKGKKSAPCDSVYEAWKREYFVDGCRYKKYSQVNEEDINKYNLILFGNPENNALIKKVIDKVPVQFYRDSIVLCNKVYRGKNLGIVMIYPNPLNPNKYIVLVSSNNWNSFSIPHLNLSKEGWYDFVIFEKTSKYFTEIKDVGYFNNNWNGLKSIKNIKHKKSDN
ncbi:MAG: hypothetical protein GXX85_07570 [Ignavibacteria bacterium]|nr:hypothetical protein [Ignavibacteria bacterium]